MTLVVQGIICGLLAFGSSTAFMILVRLFHIELVLSEIKLRLQK